MATELEYLDELMKSIEPVVYPDGVPGEDDDELNEMDFDDTYDQSSSSSDAMELKEELFEEVTEDTQIIDLSEVDLPEKEERNASDSASESVADKEPIREPIGDDIEELSLSEEEIMAMLDFAKESGEAEASAVDESKDVKNLLDMFEGDEQMQDIKNTLEKADNNVAVDASMLAEEEIEIPDIYSDEAVEEKTDKKSKKEKKAKKSKKSDAVEGEDGEVKEKKKGFFSRLLEKLTEEDEVETTVTPDNLISDENAKILSELDGEEDIKSKKKKKKKDKKGKKEKALPETEGEERDIREKGSDEETPKGKKKKEKRAKKEKAQEEDQRPVKKLPKKRVRNTFILCLSILAGIILVVFLMNDFLNKKEAREAFNKKDYETAYSDLYGMDLKDSDAEIYNKSATIMILQRKVDSYENYLRLGMKEEALNALLTGYKIYPGVHNNAVEYGVEKEVEEVYAKILEGLNSFGVDSQVAEEVNAMESIASYNKAVIALANGKPFNVKSEEEITEEVIEEENTDMQDVLPEELEDTDVIFE